MGTIRVSSYMTLKFGLTQQKVKHNCIWNTISRKFPTVFIKKQNKKNPTQHPQTFKAFRIQIWGTVC